MAEIYDRWNKTTYNTDDPSKERFDKKNRQNYLKKAQEADAEVNERIKKQIPKGYGYAYWTNPNENELVAIKKFTNYKTFKQHFKFDKIFYDTIRDESTFYVGGGYSGSIVGDKVYIKEDIGDKHTYVSHHSVIDDIKEVDGYSDIYYVSFPKPTTFASFKRDFEYLVQEENNYNNYKEYIEKGSAKKYALLSSLLIILAGIFTLGLAILLLVQIDNSFISSDNLLFTALELALGGISSISIIFFYIFRHKLNKKIEAFEKYGVYPSCTVLSALALAFNIVTVTILSFVRFNFVSDKVKLVFEIFQYISIAPTFLSGLLTFIWSIRFLINSLLDARRYDQNGEEYKKKKAKKYEETKAKLLSVTK